jgi:uncharacterized membrane protein
MPETLASEWDTNWFAVGGIAQAILALFVIIGVRNLRESRKLRIIAYEDRFEERYWNLMERLTLDALRGAVQHPTPRRCKDSDLLVARSYFRLCETQLNVRASGWITDDTWRNWGQGISDRMHHYPFTAAWDEVVSNPRANHLYRRLRQYVDGGGDPCQMKWFKRWRRCLTGDNRR